MKNDKIERGWNPENDIKDQRAKKFREHNLPVAYWRSHERLNRAEFKFFREQAHGDKRKNQDKRKPEEDRVKKRFLHRVLDLALVHERNLKIKINSSNEQEENENDIGDRRVKIAADLARKESVKLTHGLLRKTMSIFYAHLYRIRVCDLDEHIFKRRPALSQLAHPPLPRGGEPKNLLAHIST